MHRAHAIRILQFLAYAERPLRLEEAVDAIAVRPMQVPAFDKRNRMPVPREIARYCSSLTIIATRQDPMDRYEYHKIEYQNMMEIRLAHFSVKEYLVSDRLSDDYRDFFKPSRAEAEIVRVSLAYLFCVASGHIADSLQTELPLAKFCARYWMSHARVAEQEDDIAHAWTTQALTESKVLLFSLGLFNPDQPWKEETSILRWPGTPLYYASLGGLMKSVELLLNQGAEVNAQGGSYGNALCAASFGGYIEVVRLLLDKDADVNAQGGSYGNALCAASFGGQIEVVRLLLDNDADVNAQGGSYGNALCAASFTAVVRCWTTTLLLYGSALCAASFGGYIEVVRLLLNNDAERQRSRWILRQCAPSCFFWRPDRGCWTRIEVVRCAAAGQ